MSAERFSYATGDGSIRERVVDRPDRWDFLMAHVVLPPGDAVPRHPTDADAFLTVVRGTVTLEVEGLVTSQHPRGSVLYLPKGSPMAPRNEGSETAEFFVVKIPHPTRA
jgi:quercetin dioxygenase-like cupin family protein